jgi:hypothetical protein
LGLFDDHHIIIVIFIVVVGFAFAFGFSCGFGVGLVIFINGRRIFCVCDQDTTICRTLECVDDTCICRLASHAGQSRIHWKLTLVGRQELSQHIAFALTMIHHEDIDSAQSHHVVYNDLQLLTEPPCTPNDLIDKHAGPALILHMHECSVHWLQDGKYVQREWW